MNVSEDFRALRSISTSPLRNLSSSKNCYPHSKLITFTESENYPPLPTNASRSLTLPPLKNKSESEIQKLCTQSSDLGSVRYDSDGEEKVSEVGGLILSDSPEIVSKKKTLIAKSSATKPADTSSESFSFHPPPSKPSNKLCLSCRNPELYSLSETNTNTWEETERNWVSFIDNLREELEASWDRVNQLEGDLKAARNRDSEEGDVLRRAIESHVKIVEHYMELQEEHEEMAGNHRAMAEGVSEIRKAAARAGNRRGDSFANAVVCELSKKTMQRERERDFLRKENLNLKSQMKDASEAIRAAGDLLERLKKIDEAVCAAEENCDVEEGENERLKREMEEMKRMQKIEMAALKQYLQGGSDISCDDEAVRESFVPFDGLKMEQRSPYDDQSWKSEFESVLL